MEENLNIKDFESAEAEGEVESGETVLKPDSIEEPQQDEVALGPLSEALILFAEKMTKAEMSSWRLDDASPMKVKGSGLPVRAIKSDSAGNIFFQLDVSGDLIAYVGQKAVIIGDIGKLAQTSVSMDVMMQSIGPKVRGSAEMCIQFVKALNPGFKEKTNGR